MEEKRGNLCWSNFSWMCLDVCGSEKIGYDRGDGLFGCWQEGFGCIKCIGVVPVYHVSFIGEAES